MKRLGVAAIMSAGILFPGLSTVGEAGRRNVGTDWLNVVVNGGAHVVLTDARGRTSGDCDSTGERIPGCEYRTDAGLWAPRATQTRIVLFNLRPPTPGRYRLSVEVADSGGVLVECGGESAGGGATSFGDLIAEVGTRGVWGIQWTPGGSGKGPMLRLRRIEPPDTLRGRPPRR